MGTGDSQDPTPGEERLLKANRELPEKQSFGRQIVPRIEVNVLPAVGRHDRSSDRPLTARSLLTCLPVVLGVGILLLSLPSDRALAILKAVGLGVLVIVGVFGSVLAFAFKFMGKDPRP